MTAVETIEVQKRERPFYAPGWYLDLTNEQYHGSFGTSSSRLKALLSQTPAHMMYDMTHPTEPSAAMQMGTLVHTLVLEPETFDRDFVVSEKFDGRTNAGKAAKAAFESVAAGRTVITEVALEKAQAMAASVLNHPIAGALLQDTIRESSVYWWYNSRDLDDDTEYREMLKVRPDAICRNHPVILDLKTSRDATYSEYSRTISSLGYHVSAAMYLEGVNQCKPLLEELRHFAYTKFVYIVVESEPPYLTAVYELGSEALALGRQMLQHALRSLHRARKEDFPGFPDEIRIIELPPWANRGHIV